MLTLGTKLGPTPVPGCPGSEVIAKVHTLIGPQRADANGEVVFTAGIPPVLAGRLVGLQAVEPGACVVSAADTYTFPLGQDLSLATAAEARIYGSNRERVGSAVAGAGDVDGDGFDDVLVGAKDYGAGLVGAVYLMYGPLSGVHTADVALGARIVGAETISQTGTAVAGPGDVNGDGFDDVLLGALHTGGVEEPGTAYLFSGPLSGDYPVDGGTARLHGAPNDRAGAAVAGAGDLNADGYQDLIVGAPHKGSRVAGRVYLLQGPVSGEVDLPTQSTAMLIGRDAACDEGCSSDVAGSQVTGAGDHDGDGFDDVLVGAPHAINGSDEKSGAVYVVSGPVTGSAELETISSGRIRGHMANFLAGTDVSDAGDTNGDGYRDILVGAISGTPKRAFLFLGPVTGEVSTLDADASFVEFADILANVVSAAGDVNGDALDDVLIGGPIWDADVAPGAEGGSFLLLGPLYGAVDLAAAQVMLRGEPGNAHAASSIAAAGDIDRDGVPDLLVGSPDHDFPDGAAYLLAGASF